MTSRDLGRNTGNDADFGPRVSYRATSRTMASLLSLILHLFKPIIRRDAFR